MSDIDAKALAERVVFAITLAINNKDTPFLEKMRASLPAHLCEYFDDVIRNPQDSVGVMCLTYYLKKEVMVKQGLLPDFYKVIVEDPDKYAAGLDQIITTFIRGGVITQMSTAKDGTTVIQTVNDNGTSQKATVSGGGNHVVQVVGVGNKI